jgi:hypothetical protein
MKKIINKDFIKTGFFALFVSIFLLVVVFEIKKFKSEDDVKEVKDRVLNLDPDLINRISFKGFTLIRDRDAGVWRAVSPVTDYMNFKAVEGWLSKSLFYDGRKLSDVDEKVRWADFGFVKSSPEVTYYAKKNAHKLTLSGKTAFDGSAYIKYQKNKNPALLISSDPEWKDVFDKDPQEFRSLKLFDWTVPEPKSSVKVLKITKKNKVITSVLIEDEVWKSEKNPEWTLNSLKIKSFLSDLQQYVHEGFADERMRLKSPSVSLFVSDNKNNGYSINLYEQDKNVFGVVSYRPEHVLKVAKEAVDEFTPEAIEFREFSDLIKDYSVDNIKALKIRENSENKVFRFKDNLWTKTDGSKIPRGFEFNGAKVFSLLESFGKIGYKRYISEKEVIFKSAQKKLYFYQDQKNIDLTYSVGQSYSCSKKSKGANKCVLIATSKVQGYYGVALKEDVDKIFKYGFIQKITEPKTVSKPKSELEVNKVIEASVKSEEE